MGPYSFEEFKRLYDPNNINKEETLLRTHYSRHIERDEASGRISNSMKYKTSMNSIERFWNSKHKSQIRIHDVNIDFLNEYESWLLNNGKSLTTVSIYTRDLRAVMNMIKGTSLLPESRYPFGRNKYVPPSTTKVKKALPIESIKTIALHKCNSITSQKWKDLWMFSYLCSGINMRDICQLKWTDTDELGITFYRTKTINTSRQNIRQINIPLLEEARKIIDTHGDKSSTYVFGLLSGSETPIQVRNRVATVTKNVNKTIGEVCEVNGLERITSYWARHSFATVSMQKGVPLMAISKNMGHGNIKTTETYLGSFDNESKRKFQQVLVDW